MNEQQLQAEFEAKMKKMGYSATSLKRTDDDKFYKFAGVELDYQIFKGAR